MHVPLIKTVNHPTFIWVREIFAIYPICWEDFSPRTSLYCMGVIPKRVEKKRVSGKKSLRTR